MSAATRRLVGVRPGLTAWNREGRFQGHLDPPLSDAGRWQAEVVASRIREDRGLRPVRIVSSTLARASETAGAIGDAVGVAVERDARLIEIGQGDWEGRTHDEIARNDRVRYEAWRTTDSLPPGGETLEATIARVGDAVDDLEPDDAGGSILLVSHGGTLRILARILLGLSATRSWAMDVDNASIGEMTRVGDAWRLGRWNDTGHLLGRAPTHVDEAEGRPLAL